MFRKRRGVAVYGQQQLRNGMVVWIACMATAAIGLTALSGWEAGTNSDLTKLVVFDKVPPSEMPPSVTPALSRFLVAVADNVASPTQRNESLRINSHRAGIDGSSRAAAVGALGANETRGYENELRGIAHFVVPAAGWYAKRTAMRDDILTGCRGRVYHDDECYAAFLGALIAKDVPSGYAAKSVTVMSKYPLRPVLQMLQSMNWNMVQR